jgi:hypothetical protein
MPSRAVLYTLSATKTVHVRIRQERDVLYSDTPSCVAFSGALWILAATGMVQGGAIRRVAIPLYIRLLKKGGNCGCTVARNLGRTWEW